MRRTRHSRWLEMPLVIHLPLETCVLEEVGVENTANIAEGITAGGIKGGGAVEAHRTALGRIRTRGAILRAVWAQGKDREDVIVGTAAAAGGKRCRSIAGSRTFSQEDSLAGKFSGEALNSCVIWASQKSNLRYDRCVLASVLQWHFACCCLR